MDSGNQRANSAYLIPYKVFIIQHGTPQVLKKPISMAALTQPVQTTRTWKGEDGREKKCHVWITHSREDIMVDVVCAFTYLIFMITQLNGFY